MKVGYVWSTPGGDDLIAFIARVSNPSNQNNTETAPKLINYLMKHGHWSPFEMVNLCVEIETTRDIGRQILRHRSFSFQEFCIHGDSKITCVTKSRSKKRTISELYKLQFDKRWNRMVRIFNQKTGFLESAKVKEVFKTGVKPVYKMVLDGGKEIITTKEHKFLGKQGFLSLEEIVVGDFVGVNGVPVYQDFGILKEAKRVAIVEGTGVSGMALHFGISYHTVRKWLKILGLSFTKKEVAQYTEIWNKHLPKELQPRFGQTISDASREKMRLNSRSGVNSPLFKHGKSIPFRTQVWQWQSKYKNKLLNEQEKKCANCSSDQNLQIDHIKPVSTHPELAFSYSNLQLLCSKCHREKSIIETANSKKTITWRKVVSIEYYGEHETYDMEIEHESHNYVANGIITHNSQRYAEVTELPPAEFRETRLQDKKNRQNSTPAEDEILDQWFKSVQQKVLDTAYQAYTDCIGRGIAKEQARAILPEGLTTTRMYMNGTVRSWIHFLKARLYIGAQKEVREIAKEVALILQSTYPNTYEAAEEYLVWQGIEV